MLILSLDLFGIFPFAQPKRIVLKPGMNTVLGPHGSGKTMIYRTLGILLMNGPSHRIAAIPNKAAQAVLTVQCHDGGIYRIAKHFGKGDCLLTQMDPETKKFVPCENDSEKISLWLQNALGGLDEKERRLLFLIDRFRLPSYCRAREAATLPLPEDFSRQNEEAIRIRSDAIFPDFHTRPPHAKNGPDQSAKAEELKVLEKKLAALEEAHDTLLQKQDQAKAIHYRINRWQALDEKYKKKEATIAKQYPYFASEGPLAPDLLRAFEAQEREKEGLLSEIEEEMRLVVTDLSVLQDRQQPQWKEPALLGGAGLIGFSFLLPFIVTLSGPFRFLFLLGVLGGAGLSGFGYYKIIRRMAAKRALKKAEQALAEKAKGLDQNFEKEHRRILTYFEKTGAQDLSALKSLQTAYSNLIKTMEAEQKEMARALEGQTLEAMEKEASELDAEAATLSEEVKELEDVSREVYRLQEDLRSRDSSPGSLEDTFFPDDTIVPSPVETEDSFFSALFSIKKEGGVPFQREQLNQQARQLYRYFQNSSQESLTVKENGAVFVGERPLNHLSAGMADQAFLSLAFSALLQFSDLPFPILLDDPLTVLDEGSKAIAARILQHISKQRQVILFTTGGTSALEAGHRFNLA